MSLAATASAPEALKVLLPEALQGDQAGPLNSVLKPCTSVNSSNFFLRPMTGALVHPFSGSGKRAASMQTRICQHGRQCKVSVLDSATFFFAAFSCLKLQSLFVIPIFACCWWQKAPAVGNEMAFWDFSALALQAPDLQETSQQLVHLGVTESHC